MLTSVIRLEGLRKLIASAVTPTQVLPVQKRPWSVAGGWLSSTQQYVRPNSAFEQGWHELFSTPPDTLRLALTTRQAPSTRPGPASTAVTAVCIHHTPV